MANNFSSGQVVSSRYVIDREIGRGGIAIVYSAFDNVLKHEVALKLLVPPPAARDSLRHRFRREATILRELTHPNIIRVYDYVEDEDSAFLVMQLIKGGDLQRFVETNGPLLSSDLEKLSKQIISALDAAHQKGILHRDLKPSNILIDENNVAYLTDFGAAKRDNQASLITASGFVGTLTYSAPEILEGQRPDSRSDIYSLGLTLYFSAEGKLPPLHRATGVVEPSETGHMPNQLAYEALGKLIAKATRKTPSLRFLSSSEMLEAAISGTWEDYLSGYSTCPICDAPDLGADGICSVCIAGKLHDDQLTALMIPPNSKKREQENIARSIVKIFGNSIRRDLLWQVTDSQRALLVLPSIVAAKTAAQLKERGIQVRLLPASSSAALLPRDFQILTALLAFVSIYATTKSFPILGVGGMLLALGGFLLGTRIVRHPLLISTKGGSNIPSRLVDAAISTAGELKSGALRRLWGDIVRLGSHALNLTDANSDEVASRGISSLVTSLGVAVRKLDELDKYLDDLESLGHGKLISNEKVRMGLENTEQLRASIQDRIFRSLSMLGQMASSKFQQHAGLEQLTAAREAIEHDVELYAEARREVERLVG